jgi:hypothetical protein
MRGFVAVVEREIYERRLLAVVALTLSLVAVALPLVPGFLPGGFSVQDLRGGLAFGLAMLLTSLLALFLGSSIIATDLAERRLGFYFARPLSGWAIWAGKLTAALVLILGSGLVVLIPSALLGIDSNPFGLQALGVSWVSSAAVWSAGLLGLLLGAHATSVIVRSRSPWVLLDLAALGTVAGLYWGAWRRLTLAGVGAAPAFRERHSWIDPRQRMAVGFFLITLLALALAGALQVVRGRTDLRRGHRVLSLSLWGSLLAATVLLTGLSIWGISGGPGDLRQIWQIAGAPSGSWIALDGPAARLPGYQPAFLYDLSSGRFVRAGFGTTAEGFEPQVRFSADGRRAVWLAYDGSPYNSPVAVFRLDLDRPGASPVRTQISFSSVPRSIGLSPDGRRLAAYQWGAASRLTVDEIDTGRLLAAVRYESPGGTPRLAFAGPDHLRIYETFTFGSPGMPEPVQEKDPDILELDLATPAPKVEPIGRLPWSSRGFPSLILSPAADRALLRGHDGLRLCDARTGEVLATLGDKRSSASFLAGGRIAVLDRIPDGRELRILAPDGRSELRRFRLGGAREAILADQPAPDLLRVVVSPEGARGPVWNLRLLDLESGGTRSLGARKLVSPALLLFPDNAGAGSVKRPRLPLAESDGALWFDPTSFQPRVILKGPRP